MSDVIADRLNRISPSQTTAMRQRSQALKAEGKDVLAISSGEPDFDTPQHIKDAAIAAIQGNQTRYTDIAGTKALREAVARKFKRDSGLDYTAEEILVGTGGKQVIYDAMIATVNAGDEVIIPTPCWVSYPDIVGLAEGTPVLLPCGPNQGFKLLPEQLEAAITPKTKWLIVNTPSNPTGATYSAAELRGLCDVLLRHPQVHVLTDDIYEKLIYDGREFATFAQVEPKLRDRTVTMNGCSKAYAMTGWRIGFGGAPRHIIKAMDKLQGQSTSNTCSIAQAAAIAALDGPQAPTEAMRQVYEARRNRIVAALDATPHLRCHLPEGAFYAFPDLTDCIGRTTAGGTKITSDWDFVLALLSEAGVATVHGSAFLFPGHFRLSFAAADTLLDEACRRIRTFCEGLN
ncbi:MULTISPECIES: pyridoxal phosphate-dependent aminotransferase [Roseomonadaceae]|uniref:Pyridoxal phosphate-dependent aminotransferase n=1 Tax=Falsiroseomonas oleicola TaxID=2801474 RepID=A0ABS6H682_9PROT|nr:pyridoxal phosphate-dependent aminotransferase [Roseomonas oleicola]MBU8544201.1 pyridoxal phosphate-dependent aminotransferase [Roseomonas oleicola]